MRATHVAGMRNAFSVRMPATVDYRPDLSVRQLEEWTALSSGALLLLFGATRRNRTGLYAAMAAAPLLYRGLTGEWPLANGRRADTRVALAGSRGLRVRE